VDGLGHLHGQLARGDEDERGDRGRRPGQRAVGERLADALQERQGERRRLAGAGGRQPEHVAAAEQRRDGLRLDGRGSS
jgi:hypothetical protein